MENIPLLKSIENKDPSLNWNIDVSAELEKYLSAIELLDDDVNYGQNSEISEYGQNSEQANGSNGGYMQLFNFVEAALIIQNSTSLYSKKIEHLHSLVFDTFHLLSTGKSQISDGKAGGNDDADTSSQLPNKSNIVDKSRAFLMSNIASVPIELLQPGKNINLSSEQTGHSSSSDDISAKYSSYSSYIGVSSLGSSISLPQYRIDTSSNTLFLDEADLCYFSSSTPKPEQECLGDILTEERESDQFQENGQDLEVREAYGDQDLDAEANDDSEFIGASLEGMDAMESQDFIGDLDNTENNFVDNIDEKGGVQSARAATGCRKSRSVDDYWVFMDEHIKLGKDKPLKPGRTYKVPSKNYALSLESLSQKEDILNFTDVYSLISYFMGFTEIDGDKFKSGTQRLPYFSDLKPPKLNIEKLSALDHSDDEFMRSLEPDFNESTSSWKKYHSKIFFSGMDRRKRETLGSASEHEGNLQEPSEFNEIEMGDLSENDVEIEHTQDVAYGQELSVDQVAEQAQYDGGLLEDADNQDIPIVNSQGVAEIIDFEQELSELHSRINLWTGHVEPLLRAQSSRPEFDIHVEGRKIIDRMKEADAIGRPVKFEDVTSGLSKWQVCRSFLAALMLSNNREIDILEKSPDNEGDGADFFSIKLLDESEKNRMDANIEKVSTARLDFPKKKKTKKDLIGTDEDTTEPDNKAGKPQRVYRKRGNNA
ncbi:hypothetical protein OIY81_3242 [Cryptosporidium canis]|uniref:Condensin-2 complex subunit H2 C-terminal domain-containing protein n=1 Tax=Cryptosporidium canis TaxID=195482 RepID=A0ABQ8P6B6_9CRYT|nr:hypothetical protein OIY81_3242 [Cryptosporidium canis]KAJ1608811.1 hypothetical protein OJ252_2429 [Cryptosporidium canis]